MGQSAYDDNTEDRVTQGYFCVRQKAYFPVKSGHCVEEASTPAASLHRCGKPRPRKRSARPDLDVL